MILCQFSFGSFLEMSLGVLRILLGACFGGVGVY